MIPLTHSEQVDYELSECCHICKKKFCIDKSDKKKFRKYRKVRDPDHYTGKFRGAAHSICNLRYKTQREIPVLIHNGSSYDYHFIINALAKEFKGYSIDCLGENTEKYISFKVPLKKTNMNGKLVTYKLKFIDSMRFMNTSISNPTDNLSEINKQECKRCKENCKYIIHKNDVLIYKCKKCHTRSYKSIDPLKKRFLMYTNFVTKATINSYYY